MTKLTNVILIGGEFDGYVQQCSEDTYRIEILNEVGQHIIYDIKPLKLETGIQWIGAHSGTVWGDILCKLLNSYGVGAVKEPPGKVKSIPHPEKMPGHKITCGCWYCKT